ncbi:E3 ubiquitin-protein ligase FANCL-like isoform X2 [Branchiostoma floridae]|uniref:E3 ubiquitin-protein ligase FANCL-like isoform X2 n=1 Tax=Branchiostoma floridae TaxID=7739 RepID=A0A9J7LKV9_BRAFL|nr:E3 ubiquitin-protein ligase FANCL-like isoform X2 [Branchiostoma floridae]
MTYYFPGRMGIAATQEDYGLRAHLAGSGTTEMLSGPGRTASVCPMLLPQNTQATLYDGFITAGGKEYRLRIQLPPSRELKSARIDCDWRLQLVLQDKQDIFKQEQTSSQQSSVGPPPQYFTKLVQEIDKLGWDRLAYIDPSFKSLQVQCRDACQREHILTINLHNQYPQMTPTCTADLPGKVNFKWSQQDSLQGVLHQFEKALAQYQDFWDNMKELDKSTWVLEPEKPSYKDTVRRIALGNNASVQITVDPAHPRMLPECRFLGADHVINPIKQSLNANLHCWDPRQTLLPNLQNVLAVDFPSPANSSKEDFNMACSICYAYRLGEEIPDRACDDPRCSRPFHTTCLIEWLRALPSTRMSFNVIFGECPYCSKPITVKMTAAR